jgi:hypothetical protein
LIESLRERSAGAAPGLSGNARLRKAIVTAQIACSAAGSPEGQTRADLARPDGATRKEEHDSQTSRTSSRIRVAPPNSTAARRRASVSPTPSARRSLTRRSR